MTLAFDPNVKFSFISLHARKCLGESFGSSLHNIGEWSKVVLSGQTFEIKRETATIHAHVGVENISNESTEYYQLYTALCELCPSPIISAGSLASVYSTSGMGALFRSTVFHYSLLSHLH